MIKLDGILYGMKSICEKRNSSGYCAHNVSHSIISVEDIILPIQDLPFASQLPNKCKLCGYVAPDGTYFPCGHCEHNNIVKDIAIKYGYQESNVSSIGKPEGMLPEEYYLMRDKSFVKISSFAEMVESMYVFRYNFLTPEQTNFIFPK